MVLWWNTFFKPQIFHVVSQLIRYQSWNPNHLVRLQLSFDNYHPTVLKLFFFASWTFKRAWNVFHTVIFECKWTGATGDEIRFMNNQRSDTFDVHRTVPFIIVHTPGSTLLNAAKDDMECYSKILHKIHCCWENFTKKTNKKRPSFMCLWCFRSLFLNDFLDLIFNPNT